MIGGLRFSELYPAQVTQIGPTKCHSIRFVLVLTRRDETLHAVFAFITRHFREIYVREGEISVRKEVAASEGTRGVTRNVTRFGKHNYVGPARSHIPLH